ncbi:unnamed protein product [Vicia faba]|uniref:Retrovirus-related Pol polyprotein from transposon TNT 1-94-like beta-barrel domain-containing protein n=1 Tax=Vicia faba TaxID=3906 RepID=A0AAV1A2I6_VICFA|nr:unnamed protein product [Vicia faba]
MHLHMYLYYLTPTSSLSSYGFGRGGCISYHGGSGCGCHGNVKCQVCFKFGHIATNFYYKFVQHFYAPIPYEFIGYPVFQNAYNNSYTPNGFSYGTPRPNMHPRPPPSYPPHYIQLSPPSSYPPPNAMLTSSNPSANSSWFPNSGASYPISNNSKNFQQCAPFEVPKQIFIGKRQGLTIISSGSSTFLSPSNSNTSFILEKLLLVSSIAKNLITVRKFAKDNYLFLISPRQMFCEISG